MRAFVTGGTGFLGRPLVDRLRKEAEVHVLVKGDAARLPPGVRALEGDLADPAALAEAARADVVYHLAAQASPAQSRQDPLRTMETNVAGTLNLARAAAAGRARVVFASTAQVYGPSPRVPVDEDAPAVAGSPYAASKLAAEQVLLGGLGERAVVLRLFNTYGPGQSEQYVTARLLAALARREPASLRTSAPVRDFVFVDDVVEAFLRAGRAPEAAGRVVNVGTGVGTPIGDLAAQAAQLAGAPAVRFEGEGLPPGEPAALVADVGRARKVLGWAPAVPLREGLARSLAALREARS